MDMYTFLESELAKHVKFYAQKLRETKSSLRHLRMRRNTERVRFSVHLHDGWPDEKEVTIRSRPSLEKAMKAATASYRKINNRSDVQARCTVTAFVPAPGGSARINLPRSMWGQYFDEYSKAPPPKPPRGGSPFRD